jgi:maleate isomerase
MEERTRGLIAGLAAPARSLAAVKPAVVVLAHTGASYVNGFAGEPALTDRLAGLSRAAGLTAAHAIATALRHLGIKRLALGTPYPEAIGALGRAYWTAAGFEIVAHRRLEGIANIYTVSAEDAYRLARQADVHGAEAVLLSGTGVPTAEVIEPLEQDLGKPVITSVQASLWQALRLAGVRHPIHGFGRLLRQP